MRCGGAVLPPVMRLTCAAASVEVRGAGSTAHLQPAWAATMPGAFMTGAFMPGAFMTGAFMTGAFVIARLQSIFGRLASHTGACCGKCVLRCGACIDLALPAAAGSPPPQAVLMHSKNRALREEMYRAYLCRARRARLAQSGCCSLPSVREMRCVQSAAGFLPELPGFLPELPGFLPESTGFLPELRRVRVVAPGAKPETETQHSKFSRAVLAPATTLRSSSAR